MALRLSTWFDCTSDCMMVGTGNARRVVFPSELGVESALPANWQQRLVIVRRSCVRVSDTVYRL